MDERFVKRLLSSMKCGLCNKHYEPGNVNVLSHQDNVWFLSVYCSTCQSQGLVAAVVKEGKAPEIVTDLTDEELAALNAGQGIAADDILEMHGFLESFDGDFDMLFKGK